MVVAAESGVRAEFGVLPLESNAMFPMLGAGRIDRVKLLLFFAHSPMLFLKRFSTVMGGGF